MSEKAVPTALGERKSADTTLRASFEATRAGFAKRSRSAILGRLLREARN
jgi:hypothetical protein